jgi:hypothetical protein
LRFTLPSQIRIVMPATSRASGRCRIRRAIASALRRRPGLRRRCGPRNETRPSPGRAWPAGGDDGRTGSITIITVCARAHRTHWHISSMTNRQKIPFSSRAPSSGMCSRFCSTPCAIRRRLTSFACPQRADDVRECSTAPPAGRPRRNAALLPFSDTRLKAAVTFASEHCGSQTPGMIRPLLIRPLAMCRLQRGSKADEQ